MKIATVVSFRGVYLFSILLMIVRLGEAVPDPKTILKERASHVVQMEEAFDDIFRGTRGCRNENSDKFCKRFRKFCAYGNKNGKYMRTRCRFQCGCV